MELLVGTMVYECGFERTENLVHMENLINVNHEKPKVVVISRHESLLGRAVEYLMADEREWMILRASTDQNSADLVQKVEEVNPAVVIISQDERAKDEQLSMRLLQGCLELKKVILVSLEENLLEVYCKQKIRVKSVNDLFSEVENQFSNL